ncbi:MAG TPA: 2-amino-4-hydroxy-6-hydroxymethyldihydropteridine diphosphokinase [Candidatus Omnitrophica bacterium]|nr:2-amino-4-hydroxy-6-hydroxymethyldihydropteridine diphosphokinase [Candidatus Omnitrophota bacterium]
MREAFIGVGSNLGNRGENIKQAIKLLESNERIKIEKISSLIETEPQGGPPQGKYLNGVIKIKTDLTAQDLLFFLQEVERKLKRVRLVKNGPRTIDLDILLYGKEKINQDNLKIPHPRMFKRSFVLKPCFHLET